MTLKQVNPSKSRNVDCSKKCLITYGMPWGKYSIERQTPELWKKDLFDKVLISVGRKPNGNLIDAEKAGVNVDKRGFILTNSQMRTNVKNIFAIGDVP